MNLVKGATLFHITENTPCLIVEIREKTILLEPLTDIFEKKYLELPINCLGEHLFFSIEDVDADDFTIASSLDYRQYGNKKLLSIPISDFEANKGYVHIRTLEALQAQSVSNLIHFTNINNLLSIIENGLLSRDELLTQNEIKFFLNDELRLDKQTNTISLSIEFPNYSYFYKLRKNSSHNWVVLSINMDSLDFKHCQFSIYNAASTKSIQTNPILKRGHLAINDLFKRNPNSSYRLPKNFTTNPQSEVLYPNRIPFSSVNFVYFDSQVTIDSFVEKNSIKNANLIAKFIVNRDYFKQRLDWKEWSNGNQTDF